jgi:hypothetical protein
MSEERLGGNAVRSVENGLVEGNVGVEQNGQAQVEAVVHVDRVRDRLDFGERAVGRHLSCATLYPESHSECCQYPLAFRKCGTGRIDG